jgi:hypothetical protein
VAVTGIQRGPSGHGSSTFWPNAGAATTVLAFQGGPEIPMKRLPVLAPGAIQPHSTGRRNRHPPSIETQQSPGVCQILAQSRSSMIPPGGHAPRRFEVVDLARPVATSPSLDSYATI